MAAQRQIPGGAFVNETSTAQRQIPGGAYVVETGGGFGTLKTYDAVTRANLKSLNGIAVNGLKTFNGLTL